MPSFRYTARDASGKSSSGAVEAPSRKDAVRILGARGLVPSSIAEGPARASAPKTAAKAAAQQPRGAPAPSLNRLLDRTKLSRRHQLPFLAALGELINAGIPVGDSIRILSSRLQEPALKQLALSLWSKISEGASVARAMGEMPEVFEEMTINLVEAGEATGNLKDILPRLTEHYERTREIRAKILAAIAYPALLMTLAFGVVLFFLYFLLPRMKLLFDALRGEIPLAARVLIWVSQALITYGPFLIGGAVVAGILLWQWRRSTAGRLQGDRLLLRVPLVGPFLVGADMLQAAQTLSVLMENGIRTIEALRLTENNIANRAIRSAFSDTRTRVAEGASISGSLSQSPHIPSMDLDLLSIGEQTGNIVPALRSIANAHQRRQAKQIQAFISVFSTVVLFGAFSVIGAIAYAIVSAVFGLSSSITMR
jgi:type II secretory pathway component PulF